ncbi:hypothetical protein D1872_37230 [compost metagenome]
MGNIIKSYTEIHIIKMPQFIRTRRSDLQELLKHTIERSSPEIFVEGDCRVEISCKFWDSGHLPIYNFAKEWLTEHEDDVMEFELIDHNIVKNEDTDEIMDIIQSRTKFKKVTVISVGTDTSTFIKFEGIKVN